MLVGVHDSYWTHACDVDKMNRLLREKFVELYETPVLENVWFQCSLFISNAIVPIYLNHICGETDCINVNILLLNWPQIDDLRCL